MFRRFMVVVCCALGLLSAVVATTSTVAALTALNRNAVTSASRAALREDSVRSQLVTDITAAVLDNMPAAGRTEAAATAVRRSAREVVADPEFQPLWDEVVAAQYDAVFAGRREPVVLDPTAVTRLVRTQLAAVSPQVVALLPPTTVLEVSISTSSLPDLQAQATWTKRMPFIAGAATLVFFGIAIAASPRRVRTLRRIGWWLLGTGLLLTFAAFAAPQWGVPFAIRARDIAPSVNRTLIETLRFDWWRIYGPPAALALIGLVLAVIGIIAARRAPENRITRSVEAVPEAIEGQSPVEAWDCKV